MQKVEEVAKSQPATKAGKLPVSVIVAARNEEKNLPRCLEALRDVGEVYVIDSQSTDATPEIARSFGAQGGSVSLSGRLAQEAAVGDGESLRLHMTGYCWLTRTRLLLPNWPRKFAVHSRIRRSTATTFRCGCTFSAAILRHGERQFLEALAISPWQRALTNAV